MKTPKTLSRRRSSSSSRKTQFRRKLQNPTCSGSHAEAFGLIFKLSYAFGKRENPRLEIFLNDDEARENGWEIYGTLLDETDDRFADVRFNSIGEEREFQICSSRFRIQFKHCYRDSYLFPNDSKELMPVYDFLVIPAPRWRSRLAEDSPDRPSTNGDT